MGVMVESFSAEGPKVRSRNQSGGRGTCSIGRGTLCYQVGTGDAATEKVMPQLRRVAPLLKR